MSSKHSVYKVMSLACVVFCVAFSVEAKQAKQSVEPISPYVQEVLGTDVDADGIRDDVQMYLMHSYRMSPHIFSAFRRLAKSDQTLLRHMHDKKQNAKYYREWAVAKACFARDFSNKFQRQAALMMYDRITYNTMPRVKARHAVEKHQVDYVNNTPNIRCDAKR